MPLPRLPLQRLPAPIPAAQTPGSSSLLLLATSVVIVAGLYLGRSVLIPITLAVLLSFLLAPLVDALDRIHVPDALSALLAVILALGVIVGIGGLIGSQVADLAGQVPQYASTIEMKVTAVQHFISSNFDAVMREIGHPFGQVPIQHAAAGSPPPQAQSSSGPQPIPVEVHSPPTNALTLAQKIVEPLIAPLASLAIVFIVSTFILVQREDLRDRIIRLFGANDLHRTTIAMDDTARRLSRYFLAQLAINMSFGMVIATALYFIGLPTPVLWGVIAMLLRFLPYIGSPLAAVLPTLLAAATSPNWTEVVCTVALFGVLEAITGQVVEPLVYGRSTGLSPFAVVVAAIFWTWIWGPIGLILSTPLTLCLMVLGRHVERLEFLDILLGDRPALRPDESFYQRMLAGDPDEAREQAEAYVRDASLTKYYDEVAVPGLQRAAIDAGRGALAGEQLERVLESAYSLIEDLEDEADTARASTETWHADRGLVLCIAGRGPMDEAAARMLAQLLGEHGIAARVVPNRAVSRGEVTALPSREAAMLCLCYLDLGGGISHVRFLLRRLRRVMPGSPVLVGLWPADASAFQDERTRAAVGADRYVATLQQAVEACLSIAQDSRPEGEPHAA
ncbi:MAG TPA: AI-2E family transporter [Acetobacteraceae bacterium]|nr:AI-2E family transporter [Acetobacteraceae bacterium]